MLKNKLDFLVKSAFSVFLGSILIQYLAVERQRYKKSQF